MIWQRSNLALLSIEYKLFENLDYNNIMSNSADMEARKLLHEINI